jgi:hypothetical protein
MVLLMAVNEARQSKSTKLRALLPTDNNNNNTRRRTSSTTTTTTRTSSSANDMMNMV